MVYRRILKHPDAPSVAVCRGSHSTKKSRPPLETGEALKAMFCGEFRRDVLREELFAGGYDWLVVQVLQAASV